MMYLLIWEKSRVKNFNLTQVTPKHALCKDCSQLSPGLHPFAQYLHLLMSSEFILFQIAVKKNDTT